MYSLHVISDFYRWILAYKSLSSCLGIVLLLTIRDVGLPAAPQVLDLQSHLYRLCFDITCSCGSSEPLPHLFFVNVQFSEHNMDVSSF